MSKMVYSHESRLKLCRPTRLVNMIGIVTLESNPTMRATAAFACAFVHSLFRLILKANVHFYGNFDVMKVICNYRLCSHRYTSGLTRSKQIIVGGGGGGETFPRGWGGGGGGMGAT